ncbi:hypothetical protein AXG93_3884s1420 [Marchantia polymorpha subsp. ruderalis]|uniref:Uncharacterized protein n=1 Tax=Marchantia polymorpha subsp. ruderalis TaxID=1480154 RepID=A0A176WCA3_MARPO|nr:hypothetical protein AXG93_3884s1420 [Marchantia polymorpha subsp. ruderalis]
MRHRTTVGGHLGRMAGKEGVSKQGEPDMWQSAIASKPFESNESNGNKGPRVALGCDAGKRFNVAQVGIPETPMQIKNHETSVQLHQVPPEAPGQRVLQAGWTFRDLTSESLKDREQTARKISRPPRAHGRRCFLPAPSPPPPFPPAPSLPPKPAPSQPDCTVRGRGPRQAGASFPEQEGSAEQMRP